MCRLLNIPRSLVYYKKKSRGYNTKLENAIIEIFRSSKNSRNREEVKFQASVESEST